MSGGGIAAATPENIRRAAEAVAAGGLAVVPTETVYGVAADAGNPAAMERLYALKGRPAGKPVARMVCGAEALDGAGVEVSETARRLARRFWPGPLTLVLPLAGGGGEWVGLRAPDHPVALAWLRELLRLGVTPAVTSANASGEAPAVTAADASAVLGAGVDIVLDGGRAEGGRASTVVRVRGETLEILREGPLGRAELEAVAAAARG